MTHDLRDTNASEVLRQALKRIAAATPVNTNSRTPESMSSWCRAVARTALEDCAERSPADPAARPEEDDAAFVERIDREGFNFDEADADDTVERLTAIARRATQPAPDDPNRASAVAVVERLRDGIIARQPEGSFKQGAKAAAELIIGHLLAATQPPAPVPEAQWRTIDSAPKDGTFVLGVDQGVGPRRPSGPVSDRLVALEHDNAAHPLDAAPPPADLDQPTKPMPRLVIPDAEIERLLDEWVGLGWRYWSDSVATKIGRMRADLDRIIAARVPKEDGR